MYVYIIINKITKSYYIGITNGKKKNYFGSGHALADAIKKYERNNFKKSIVEKCLDRNEASIREQFWIEYAKNKWPNRHCLNLTSGGENNYERSKEVNDKIREKLISYYHNHPELKEKYREHAKNTIVKYINENGFTTQKLFKEDRKKIIYDYINYLKTGVELAKEYNVTPSCINSIVNPYLKKRCSGSGNGSAKLNENIIKEIRNNYQKDNMKENNYISLARKYNVTYQTISRIINRKSWTHI